MPQVESPKRKSHATRWTILILVVLLLLAAGGGVAYWLMMPKAADVVKDADKLNAKGKYAQSYSELKNAYGHVISKNDKTLILSRLAPTALRAHKNEEALTYQQELLKTSPDDYSLLLQTGDLAMQLHRYDIAVPAYKKCVEHLKKSQKGIYTDYQIQRLNGYIDEMEKSK